VFQFLQQRKFSQGRAGDAFIFIIKLDLFNGDGSLEFNIIGRVDDAVSARADLLGIDKSLSLF